MVFADEGFAKIDWHPVNLRVCRRGEWNNADRDHLFNVDPRLPVEESIAWTYFKTRLAFLWRCLIS